MGFQKDLSLYFFISGIVLLFIAPFLPWFYYGFNFRFPSRVSLIYLSGFLPIGLTLYLIGVAAAIIVPLRLGRPVFFQGILPTIFPFFIFSVFAFQPYYPHVQSPGIFAAFLGSALLEVSYFSYRYKKTKLKSTTKATMTYPLL